MAAAAAEFGKIDILVNNAGGPPFGKFESFDESAWQSAFELNLLSFVRINRLVIPHMRPTGNGRIINIISFSVKTFLENSVLSTSLRMGVVGMAKMLAAELGPDNITVNNIAPGPILAPPGTTDDESKTVEQATPLGRWGGEIEIAKAVAALLDTDFVTGETIRVDGGRHIK